MFQRRARFAQAAVEHGPVSQACAELSLLTLLGRQRRLKLAQAGLVLSILLPPPGDLLLQRRQQVVAVLVGQCLAAGRAGWIAGQLEHRRPLLQRLGLRRQRQVDAAQAPGLLRQPGGGLRRRLQVGLQRFKGIHRLLDSQQLLLQLLLVGARLQGFRLAAGRHQLRLPDTDAPTRLIDLALQPDQLMAGVLQIGPLLLCLVQCFGGLRRLLFRRLAFVLIPLPLA